MSAAIPPNFLSSIIQTQDAQKRASEARQTEQTADRNRAQGGSFAEKVQDIIETGDRDTSVFADAEGTGSQGRAFSPPDDAPTTPADDDAEAPPDAGGIDIQA